MEPICMTKSEGRLRTDELNKKWNMAL